VAYDNTDSIIAYACGALDVNAFERNIDICWLPELREKYPRTLLETEDDGNSKAHKIIAEFVETFHNCAAVCPPEVFGSFPALLWMFWCARLCTRAGYRADELLLQNLIY